MARLIARVLLWKANSIVKRNRPEAIWNQRQPTIGLGNYHSSLLSRKMVSTIRRARTTERQQRSHRHNYTDNRDWTCRWCRRTFANYKNGPLQHLRACKLKIKGQQPRAEPGPSHFPTIPADPHCLTDFISKILTERKACFIIRQEIAWRTNFEVYHCAAGSNSGASQHTRFLSRSGSKFFFRRCSCHGGRRI